MKFKNIQRLMSICIIAVVCLSAGTVYSQSRVVPRTNYVLLDQFYSEEVTRFNREIEKYIAQLEDCLDEMSRFEQGWILLESILCPRFKQIRPQITGLMDDVEIVINDYRKAVQEILARGSSGDVYDTTQISVSRAMALMRIYKVKLQQAEPQSKRVQQHEGEILSRLESLTQGFNPHPQSKVLKTPTKKPRK